MYLNIDICEKKQLNLTRKDECSILHQSLAKKDDVAIGYAYLFVFYKKVQVNCIAIDISDTMLNSFDNIALKNGQLFFHFENPCKLGQIYGLLLLT